MTATGTVSIPDAVTLAAEIRAGERRASDVCAEALRAGAGAPGIFWELDAERARTDAARIDAIVRADAGAVAELGPLAGVPVAVKDSFDVAGLPTRAGLPAVLRVAGADAPAVARLRAAGAIVVGKTAMDQLAWSMGGQAPGFPPLENPAAPGHLTGGSSGGSAAAVAAGIVPLALGTDTAGSIRVPAAWCGVTAVKPSRGAVPLDGTLPLAPNIDTIGVIGRSARDCANALQALGLHADATADTPAGERVRCVVLHPASAPWFGAAAAPLFERDDWERASALDDLPAVRLGRILAAEFAAAWPAPEGVSPEIEAGLARGRTLDPAAIALDRVALAEAGDRLRARLHADGARLLVLPAVEGPAPAIGDATTVAAASRFTRTLSAFGWPCATLPCGRVDGRPVGLQLAAAPGDDRFLLASLARAERAIDPEARLA